AIALQVVRIADVRLGENVAVIGLGLLGQLAVQILAAAGCRVFGIDLDAEKVALARELGAEGAVVRSEAVTEAAEAFTNGMGFDAVVITAATDSNDPVELAGELCRDRGVVSVVGAVKMDVPRRAFYEKELQLRLSRSYGPGRYDPEYEEKGHDYPIGYVRWTERRNLGEFLRLLSTGAVRMDELITHRFPFAEVERAYGTLTGEEGRGALGVVLEYPEEATEEPRRIVVRDVADPRAPVTGPIGVGLIGAGNFAQDVLIPSLKRLGVEFRGVVT